ncbi:universal stress protein [uncultured Azohydromonas sp.]|jgi:Universal stress protein UspA and related nucleotide-binding proteins|uniref:universal stress protein n=1 Tax=uncultured Azohydromonas sp. TaxID=487342 RepID=UPI0026278872|nr:universal stress protein [uncultured Azohydromonas sp.]
MSPIASILLHVDPSPRCAARIGVASALAHRLDATVTALYTPAPVLPHGRHLLAEGQSLVLAPTLDAERRAQARALFDSADAGALVRWAEIDADRPVVPAFVRQALVHDLVVLGQFDRDDPAGPGVPADFVETVALDSGRPVLSVPYAGRFTDVGQRVLIAWKPTRESARAVAAALPLLQEGAEVHVASWGSDPHELEPLLRRHGIEAEYHREGPAPHEIGDALLSLAADVSADLLVMGCYGHSRARELMLGGASRTVLQSMTVPVLLAH